MRCKYVIKFMFNYYDMFDWTKNSTFLGLDWTGRLEVEVLQTFLTPKCVYSVDPLFV